MIKNLFNLKSDRLGFKAVFHVIMRIAISFFGNQLALLPIDLFYAITKLEGTLLTIVAMNILRIAIPLLLTSLYIIRVLKMPLSDFRIQKPKSMAVWILYKEGNEKEKSNFPQTDTYEWQQPPAKVRPDGNGGTINMLLVVSPLWMGILFDPKGREDISPASCW